MKSMIYLDSNVFIPAVVNPPEDKMASMSRAILQRVAERSFDAATCALTWDELVWVIRKKLGYEIARDEGRKFLEFPNIDLLGVTESTAFSAQRLIEAYGTKPRDAIHAACCIENRMDEIVSNDSEFDKIEEIRRIPLERAVKL